MKVRKYKKAMKSARRKQGYSKADVARTGRVISRAKRKKNPAKSVRLKDFSGTIRVNPDKTVSIIGRRKNR